MLIASGMGKVADGAAVVTILLIALAIQILWLLLRSWRTAFHRREPIALIAMWLLAFVLARTVIVNGRAADERRHREDFPEFYDQAERP